MMQLQAMARTAEGIGKNDVGTSFNEAAMQIGNAVRMIGIPQFR